MDRIIRTCKLTAYAALALLPAAGAVAAAEKDVDLYLVARLAEIEHRNADALGGFLKLYKQAPDSAILTDRVFENAIRTGDLASAVRAVRAQELKGEVSAEAPLILFADAFRSKKWSMALLAAEELESRSNFGFMAPVLRAWVAVAKGEGFELPDGSAQPDSLYSFYSNDQRVYLDLASGRTAKAKLGLRNMALVGGDAMRDLYIAAAPVIAKSGDESFAQALIGTAIGTQDAEASIMRGTGRITAEQGLSAFHTRISLALLEQEMAEPALAIARIGLWHDPASDTAKIATAKALAAQGDFSGAMALYDGVPATSPYWTRMVIAKIDTMTRKGQTEAAAKFAKESSSLRPGSLPLAMLYGQTLQKNGDARQAAEQLRMVVERSEGAAYSPRQQATYRLLLASALDDAGDWNGAKKELEAALVLDPNNGQVLNFLGYAMLDRNEDSARAASLIERAYKLLPDSAAITDSMGWVHYRRGDFATAVTLLEKAAKSSSNDTAINEHLGDAYWQLGRRRDARYAWRTAAQIANTADLSRIATKIEFGLPEGSRQH